MSFWELFELDGRKPGPIPHGPTSPGSLLQKSSLQRDNIWTSGYSYIESDIATLDCEELVPKRKRKLRISSDRVSSISMQQIQLCISVRELALLVQRLLRPT
ncbi:hypothetical protein K2173_012464 [Erythroxylum novogranatense]|uniref:Uncharacterized protein n=1 Tax=Erythroxylum novogranatense TaxID=1862640 RepID=A0AAV8U8X4_9ROSI|nr:hypothetical protein K2173_012464 [Erythroxylum novogranatense]